MALTNYTKFPTEEIEKLLGFVAKRIKSFLSFDVIVQMTSTQYAEGAGAIFFDYPTTKQQRDYLKNHLCLKDWSTRKLITNSLVSIYIFLPKGVFYKGANILTGLTWQENFVIVAAHELEHLNRECYAKKLLSEYQEDLIVEKRALKNLQAFRKAKRNL